MLQAAPHRYSQIGLTLMEMLIALTVLAILASLSVPGLTNFGIKHKLIGAAEQVYGHLQQARSDSIASSRVPPVPTFVKFDATGTTTWQYGMSTRPSGDCDLDVTAATTANSCVIVVNDGDTTIDPGDGSTDTGDLVLMRFTDADYTGNNAVEMTVTIPGGGSQFVFDPVRGTLTTVAGQVDLESTATGLQLRVTVSALGRIAICSPGGSVANYEVCP